MEVTIGSAIDLTTNAFPVAETGDISREFFVYKVTFTSPAQSASAAAAILQQALFPDDKAASDNPMFFDGFLYLFSPTELRTSSDSIKLELHKTVSLQNDFSFILNAVLSKSLTCLGYSCLSDGWFLNDERDEVGSVEILHALSPNISRTLLIWSPSSITKRKGTLYEFLSPGISSNSARSGIERAVKSLRFAVANSPGQKIGRVIAIHWTPTKEKEAKVTKPMKSGEPLVEFDDGSVIPSSCLVQIGLSTAEKQDKAIAEKSHETASAVKSRIEKLMSALKVNEEAKKACEFFGLSFGEALETQGRVLEAPMLTVREKTMRTIIEIPALKSCEFCYDVSDRVVVVPPRLNKQVLFLVEECFESKFKNGFISRFLETAAQMGVSLMTPNEAYPRNTHGFIDELKQTIKDSGLPSYVVVVVRDVNRPEFATLRKFMAVDLGIPAHFVVGDTLVETNTITDMVRGLVIRTGGIPYYVSLPLRSTIVLGISTLDNKNFSVAASIDNTLARYRYDILELNNLQAFLKQTIIEFTKMTSTKPTRLLLYALESEHTNELKKKVLEATQRTDLKVTMCLVQPDSPFQVFVRDSDTYESAPIGTLVYQDTSGGQPTFLIKTTTEPAQYTLIDGEFDLIRLAQITFGLCFNFTKTPRAERIPAPLMVANANLDYCRTWLQGAPPAPALRESLLHFI